jgi:hypothetical protein
MNIDFTKRFSLGDGRPTSFSNRHNITVGEYLGEVLDQLAGINDTLHPTTLCRIAEGLETLAVQSVKHNELTAKTNSRLAWIEEALTGRTGGPRDPVASETLTDKGLLTPFNSQGEQEVV